MLYNFGDPKYQIEVIHVQKPGAADGATETCARLVNRATGKPIPHDEPVFILRGQDYRAALAISQYANACIVEPSADSHQAAVLGRHDEFMAFAEKHPERMKWPD